MKAPKVKPQKVARRDWKRGPLAKHSLGAGKSTAQKHAGNSRKADEK